MQVFYSKKFLKELASIPSKTRIKVETLVFTELPEIDSISKIKNLKKLKGHATYYRIKEGDYRIGIRLTVDSIVFERIFHRKEIYKFFP